MTSRYKRYCFIKYIITIFHKDEEKIQTFLYYFDQLSLLNYTSDVKFIQVLRQTTFASTPAEVLDAFYVIGMTTPHAVKAKFGLVEYSFYMSSTFEEAYNYLKTNSRI